jgi:hypothetical protein
MRKPKVMDVVYLSGAKIVSKDDSFSQCILNVNGGKLRGLTSIFRLPMSTFHTSLDYNCKARLNVLFAIVLRIVCIC